MIGTQLHNLQITEHIANSGNATVWRAVNSDGESVAVKVLLEIEEPKKRNKRKARFESEIEKLKYARSQNVDFVMPVIDQGYTDDDRPWYSMPIAEPFLVPDHFIPRIELLATICDVVANLHKLGMEHRDIKPNNLLFLKGQITLCDFGLSRLIGDPHLTDTGEKVGSVGYTADECVGRSDTPRFECDVYSLGKLMWVALSNQDKPPSGELKLPQDDLTEYWPDHEEVVRDLQALMFESTDRDPAVRPSARQLHKALNAIINPSKVASSSPKSSAANRAKTLFGHSADKTKRHTKLNSQLQNMQLDYGRIWCESWQEVVAEIGLNDTMSMGGRHRANGSLHDGWRDGQRCFTGGVDWRYGI